MNARQHKVLIILFCLTAAVLAFVLYPDRSDTDALRYGRSHSAARQSSFAYKFYGRHSQYRKVLGRKMSDSYETMKSHLDDDRTMPVPGIIETVMSDGEFTVTSDAFVPQGLSKAGGNFLVTAYDADRENNSVIYVINREKGRVISTLTLPNRYHAGGIAFDGERIWVTGDTSDKYEGKPFVQYIGYAEFEEMIREPQHRIKKKEMSGKVYIKNKPSFLEYSSGKLWVGTYAESRSTHRGYINAYPIISENGKARLDTMMYQVISGIDSSAQGAAVFGNYMYVSSSYMGWTSRVKTSFVTLYDIGRAIRKNCDLNVSGKELRRIEVPKMNEEIYIDQGILYINFESAYDGWPAPVIRTDRILAVRRNLWR